MTYKQVGLRLSPQQLVRVDEFAKKHFEGARSTAVRWLAMKQLDQIEGATTSDLGTHASQSAAKLDSHAEKIAQLERKVKVLQRQVGPASIF